MAKHAGALFPVSPPMGSLTGVLPYQAIRALVSSREIRGSVDIAEDQIQPASIDLRLGSIAYRVRASFLPGPDSTVQEKIEVFGMHAIDLSEGAVLEKGCVYIVPLMEQLELSSRIGGLANPKSSTGRLDIFTRLITDYASDFERVRNGYAGPMYVEIFPRAFSVLVRRGTKLNQLRFLRGSTAVRDSELRRLQDQGQILGRELSREETQSIARGFPLTVELAANGSTNLVGYKAKTHTGLIDVDARDRYDPLDFWEPIFATDEKNIVLNPEDFYILASKESVSVPPEYVAEMVAYDTFAGEFRAHYAGFFDPGFGAAETGGEGARAVLEVRSHGVPFVIGDGQVVGRLRYEKIAAVPDKLYGADIGSSYQKQGLALGKQFRKQ